MIYSSHAFWIECLQIGHQCARQKCYGHTGCIETRLRARKACCFGVYASSCRSRSVKMYLNFCMSRIPAVYVTNKSRIATCSGRASIKTSCTKYTRAQAAFSNAAIRTHRQWDVGSLLNVRKNGFTLITRGRFSNDIGIYDRRQYESNRSTCFEYGRRRSGLDVARSICILWST